MKLTKEPEPLDLNTLSFAEMVSGAQGFFRIAYDKPTKKNWNNYHYFRSEASKVIQQRIDANAVKVFLWLTSP